MILKVCGITNREDAEAAVAAGANALGFNFYSLSPRAITPADAARIGARLPVTKVGVFVNESRDRVAEIVRIAGLDVAQLHGDETAADFPAGIAIWKALRVDEDFHLFRFTHLPVDALLLDGPADALYGGAGIGFDWRLAAQSARRIIIAGGLDASNVASAIAQARPWGVDVCSRIESAPGKKDHERMIAFLTAAKEAFAC